MKVHNRYFKYWRARFPGRVTRVWRWDHTPRSKLPKVLAEWPCDIGVSTHDLAWPLDEPAARLHQYDLVYLMMRFQWKNYTSEHYRMLVRRVLDREVDYV